MPKLLLFCIAAGSLGLSEQTPTPDAPSAEEIAGLFKAIDGKDAARAKKLLAAAPRLALQKNAQGDTPLHVAARGKSVEIVKLLLDARADVNARADDDVTPLYLAAAHGHRD